MIAPSDEALREVWFEAIMAFGRVYGVPLPKEMLTLGGGGSRRSLKVILNATGHGLDHCPAFQVMVRKGSVPMGSVGPNGGILVDDTSLTKERLILWLQAHKEPLGAD